jgi:uncharacterized protein (DUF58 family)
VKFTLRPAGFPGRAVTLGGLVVAFFFVARATGAGWVVVLLCAQAALVVIGTIWPAVTVGRVRVELLSSPRDATAGAPATFGLVVRRAGGGVRIRLNLGGNTSGWLAAAGTCRGDTAVAPPRRGIVTAVTAELNGAGPLGLMPWSRRLVLALKQRLDVGPVPASVGVDELAGLAAGADNGRSQGSPGHDSFKGIRMYAPGDPIRRVHWPATARWGELMVKEMEDPAAAELHIVVDLRGEPDRTEQAASLAAGLAGAALGFGVAVRLFTAEATGPQLGAVRTPVEVGRRLARALADTTATPPSPSSLSSSSSSVDASVIRVSAQ